MSFASPAAANAAGIACIFQELSLIPDLSVADNIVISNPPTRFGMIDRSAQRRIAEEALARAGAEDIHPLALVKDLPLSRRQMVEIAKALARKPRILILDEATSALTAADVAKIFAVLKRLRSEGLALLYISHRMHEIAELADECTVFRNGRNVASYEAGTKIRQRSRRDDDRPRIQPRLSAEAGARARRAARRCWNAATCRWTDRLRDISLTVGAGEVVGLGGLDGQGQRELLLAFFGVLRGCSGPDADRRQAGVDRQPGRAPSGDGIGMALIPEDRKTEGLMLPMSVRENLSFAALDRVSQRRHHRPRRRTGG